MALSVKPLWSDEFVAGLQPSAQLLMLGEIKVTEENFDDPDAFEPTVTTLYEGKARIQPMRGPLQANAAGELTTLQGVRIQVPLGVGAGEGANFKPWEIATNQWVEVTKSPHNPELMNYVYRVHEIVDSSNPVERTFETRMDNKRRG